jgi:hypothetical protein
VITHYPGDQTGRAAGDNQPAAPAASALLHPIPPNRTQPNPSHRSDWVEHYAEINFAVCRPAQRTPKLASAWSVYMRDTDETQ